MYIIILYISVYECVTIFNNTFLEVHFFFGTKYLEYYIFYFITIRY
jgi:hypothetical protein